MKQVAFARNNCTQDTHFLVSDEDYDNVMRFKWHVSNTHSNSLTKAPHYRVERRATKAEKTLGHPTTIKLYRFIFDLKKGDEKIIVDHVNNWLDNTREALRLTTIQNNNRYLRTPTKKSLLPKGVYKNSSKTNPYSAQIYVDSKKKHLGNFPTVELAYDAYKAAATYYFGEFARFDDKNLTLTVSSTLLQESVLIKSDS